MTIKGRNEQAAGPIRYGMVGGGQGAFIGGVHRIAARMDGEFALVAGALSSDPERARASGTALGLDPDRNYASFEEMVGAEAKLPDGIEVVAIVTPNHMHYPTAKAFLEAGIHVICDKPLTSNLGDAKKLATLVERSGKLFVLTHNYTGYPMVRQAREMVARGVLGDIRIVQAEYPQDWLTEDLASTGLTLGSNQAGQFSLGLQSTTELVHLLSWPHPTQHRQLVIVDVTMSVQNFQDAISVALAHLLVASWSIASRKRRSQPSWTWF